MCDVVKVVLTASNEGRGKRERSQGVEIERDEERSGMIPFQTLNLRPNSYLLLFATLGVQISTFIPSR